MANTKSDEVNSHSHRSMMVGAAATVAVAAAGQLAAARAQTPTTALASWNDGPAKQAILDFVRATTDQASPKFVPQAERIATFGQDGTLWVEHPMYSQVIYCLARVPAVVKAKPALATVEPFKTVLSGNREAIAKFTMPDLFKILAATLTGMSVDEFDAQVKAWIATAKHPRWNRAYTDLTYQPMQEVMPYLRANGYKTYFVTGGRQDFVRVYAEQVYGIPPEQAVGSMGGVKFGYDLTASSLRLQWLTGRLLSSAGFSQARATIAQICSG